MIFGNSNSNSNSNSDSIDVSALVSAVSSLASVDDAQVKTGLDGFSPSLTVSVDYAHSSDVTEQNMRALAQALAENTPSEFSAAELRVSAADGQVSRETLASALAFIPTARIDSMGFVLVKLADLREAVGHVG